ncbi:MAG: AMP-binding protein [Gammaproteobacteria bacterium]|nr:AMP-binding protein [Gammaproteobacteria bacterium]
MPEYYDELETREPQARAEALFAALPAQIAHAKQHAPAFGELFGDVDPAAIDSPAALASLPVTRKSTLIEKQQNAPPFGGMATASAGQMARVFSSPGPIFEPEGHAPDYWRTARALFAAGFRAGDLLHNCFAYHFTPAGSMLETGARALGCGVFAGGTGQTELQVEAVAALRPDGYTGTPSFLKIILDKAAERGTDVSSLRKALVSAEALPPSLRDALAEYGVSTLQCYASADLGLIAYESPALQGMIVDEGVIVEIVRPGTGEPVPEGEVGEVVVTTFNRDYPLIRFATGDLSAVLPGISPCGRTNLRIKGWMGRADQTTKVKGMFVHPEQVAEVLRRHPEVVKGRLVVDREADNDVMTLHCEVASSEADLADALVASLREVCKLRGEVVLLAPGSLANDGKVIDDVRSYE